MMGLPKFDREQISSEELFAEQKRLQLQANKMLTQTRLLGALAACGDVAPIGGSYAYDLMVYPDLDMTIVMPEVAKSDAATLAARLSELDYVRKLTIVDNVHFTTDKPGRPRGYWFGLEVPFEGDKWGGRYMATI